MDAYLDFEKPIATLERKLKDLRELSSSDHLNLQSEIKSLEEKVDDLVHSIFSNLTPWQRVQLSRHPNRPYAMDYVRALFPDMKELHGDRRFSDDRALFGGIASWPPRDVDAPPSDLPSESSVMIMGHQKGRTTKQKMERNFGMARPEGYRKAVRLMECAERFRLPIVTLIDTPGAYPGIDAEERGQSQAIAESIRAMFDLTVPVLSLVIGEGGSGGALAIGVGNLVLMEENSTYSVISAESCASILWSDASQASRASECLKMDSANLSQLGIIDDIIPEPLGGAHRDWKQTFLNTRKSLIKHFDPMVKEHLKTCNGKKKTEISEKFKDQRFKKFREIGNFALGSSNASSPSKKTQKKKKKKTKRA